MEEIKGLIELKDSEIYMLEIINKSLAPTEEVMHDDVCSHGYRECRECDKPIEEV